MALSLVLAMTGILCARSLHSLRSVESGFHRDDIVLAALDPVRSGYTVERARVFYEDLLDRLRAQPGVRGAGLAGYGSLSGVLAVGTRFVNTPMHAAGQQVAPAADATVYLNTVTPGYFNAVGMAIRRGRDFARGDGRETQRVAIINDTAARYFFGDANPIGQRIGAGRAGPADIEVVGVVNDAKYLDLREATRRIVYRPHAQAFRSLMTLHASGTGDPGTLASLIEQEVRALDPAVPVFQVQTMRARIDDSLRQERLVAAVATTLSMLGALLAAVGVFGVVNYSVKRRTRELAVRIAVGALPRQILAEVLRRALAMVLLGVIGGIPLTMVSIRLYDAFLYGVTGADAAMLGGASLALVLIGFGAAYLPARRAVRIDPMVALRND